MCAVGTGSGGDTTSCLCMFDHQTYNKWDHILKSKWTLREMKQFTYIKKKKLKSQVDPLKRCPRAPPAGSVLSDDESLGSQRPYGSHPEIQMIT